MSESTISKELKVVLNGLDERLTRLSADFIGSHDGLGEQFKSLEGLTNILNERLVAESESMLARTGELFEREAPDMSSLEVFIASHEESAGKTSIALTQIGEWIKAADLKIDSISGWINGADKQIDSMLPKDPEFDQIYTALALAQMNISNAEAQIDNEFTGKKYADLASVLNAVRGPLAEQGIALFQTTYDPDIDGQIGIKTTLAHKSGQVLEDYIFMNPPKKDPQGIGSCRTYMRRYSLMAMTGIAGALDDDAEGTKTDPEQYDRVSPEQIDELLALADKHFDRLADAKVNRMLDKAFQVAAVGDIPASLFDSAINLLNNQKLREDKEEKAAKKKPAKAAD